MKKTLTLAAVLTLCLAAARAGGTETSAFAADQNLVAVVRCPSPARANDALVRLLRQLNPFYAGKRPLLDAMGPRLFNAGMQNIDTSAWAEAVRFAQPLEKDPHWTYIFNVTDERKYVADMLAMGNIRQEAQEKSITRYRRTGTAGEAVFYLVFLRDGGHRVAILGDNFAAVERARTLYLPFLSGGLLDAPDDFSWVFHGTRFYLSDTQFLPQFFSMLQQDLTTELAGVTVKPDNPAALFLARGLRSLQRIVKEMAIIRGGLVLGGDSVRLAGSATLQYGGSLHYALSSMDARPGGLAEALPPETEAVAAGRLWPELSQQILERFGEAAQEIFPENERGKLAPPVKAWAELFARAELLETAVGIVPGQGNGCGPLSVALLRWGHPEHLPELWRTLTQALDAGALAEALSEHGIKWETITAPDTENLRNKWTVYRTQTACRTLNFTLPGILAGTQRYLTALAGDTLVVVTPSAPLELDQYRVAEETMLRVMTAALENLEAPKGARAGTLLRGLSAEAFFRAAAHPLTLAQLALQSEAVWPQPGETDRLPVPWGQYAEELRNFPAKQPPLEWRLESQKNALGFTCEIPNATLAECAAAFLDCRPAAESGKNAGKP